MTGRIIAHYQITEKLGEGGMGVVYKARDTHLDRFVAIKVLPPERVADPSRKARFVQEAKAASALNHPNIVHVYDIATDGGTDFIAMEYVAGKTLDQFIPRKGMRIGEALKIAVQIVDALARAHAAGIIHRDLKPSNIMVDEHGLVKVLDFGLAKLIEQAISEDEATATIRVATEEGVVAGTAAYMSPEQAEGKPLDARSDIFSFGAVLYEMWSGRRAFSGLRRDEPEALAGLPAEAARIVRRCLRPDPTRRFQHMADVKVSLEELREESESGTLAVMPPRRARLRRWGWAAAAVALLVIAGVAAWLAVGTRRALAPVLNPVPLTSFPGYEREPSFSPDGSQVAFSWNGDKQDNFDIYVMLVKGGRPLRLTTDPADDVSPVWSPDGRNIAFLRVVPEGKAAVILVPPLGGPERKLGEVYFLPVEMIGPYLSWSPAGDSLAVIDQAVPIGPAGLFRLFVETGEKRRLTSPPREAPQGDTGPAFSPDGSSLVFNRVLGSGISDLYLLPIAPDGGPAGEPRRLTFGNWNVAGAAWASLSAVVFSSPEGGKRGLWRVPVSGKGEPSKLPLAADRLGSLAISPRFDRLIVTRFMDDSNIWRVELPGGRISGPFISSTHPDNFPEFSPDGSRIAFSSHRSGAPEIWVSDADGSNAVQLTSMRASVTTGPTWSPDGQRIAFHSNGEGSFEVYVVGAGGGRPLRLTDDPDAADTVPRWSRDGKWIYFRSTHSGQSEIWRMPGGQGGADRQAVQVTHSVGNDPYVSPDGKWFYYRRGLPGKDLPGSGLWRMPVGGGEETQILNAVPTVRCYAVFDDGVYFLRPEGTTAVLQFLDLATGRSTSIATIGKPPWYSLTVSPNRRWALFSQTDQQASDLMLVENFR